MNNGTLSKRATNPMEYDELSLALHKLELLCANANNTKVSKDAQEKIIHLQQRILRLQKISKLI